MSIEANQDELVATLTTEVFDVLQKYEGRILMVTALGVLDVIKHDMIQHQRKSLLDEMLREKNA